MILFAGHSFTATSDKYFYLPFGSVNDSPPIIGTFPTDSSQSAFYFFDPTQIGAHDFSITVDGYSTLLGPEYLAGPVTAPLPNGGQHSIIFGVFLSPLNPGEHTVEIKGQFDGALIGGSSVEDITYTVDSNAAPVPESSSTPGVLVFGALGAGSLWKRKQKRQKSARGVRLVIDR